MKKYFTCLCIWVSCLGFVQGQDPHFSQYFMAPQLVNPAASGTGSSAWRVMANMRQQWNNAGTAFNTSSLSGDTRFRIYEGSTSFIGVGGQVLSDKSLNGAFSSMHAAGSLSYHVQLGEQSHVGWGIQGMYSRRRLDYTALRFGEQFTSGGFDAALPSGEGKLADNRSFMSVGAGMQYTFQSESMAFDVGAAAFHLNRPVQSMVNDVREVLPVRYTFHGSVDYKTYSDWIINAGFLYQGQGATTNMAAGASFGKDISFSEVPIIVNAGAWYRYADAIYPFISLQWDKVQVGISYDVNVSKQLTAYSHPRSVELSLVIKDVIPGNGFIPCPWK